jgi:signal transduction histidine kinase
VSHELRTPIASIKLYLRLLTLRPEKEAAYLDRLNRETNRLEHIIEDLLQLSRIDQGRTQLKLTPTNFNWLARQFVTDRAPLAEERGLKMILKPKSGLPLVQADEMLLGQALSILLTNALNYTPSGGYIEIHTRTRQIDKSRWAGLSVQDNGPGIPPDEASRLFQRFFRGKVGRESGAPGTGLGLAIAKQIIEWHGGHIEVASNGIPGEGVTFTIWLPVGASATKLIG